MNHPKQEVWTLTTWQGRTLVVRVRMWREMRVCGEHSYPMNRCPFKLVCVVVTTLEGEAVYARPLWLALYGPLRHELSAQEIHAAYSQRFDQEDGQRFLTWRIISQIGTPACRLKPRGNPRRRRQGTRLPPRPRWPIVRKGQRKAKTGV